MHFIVRLFRKYEKVSIILLTFILTVTFVINMAQIGNLLQEFIWRIFTYISFATFFILVILFRDDIFKNGK
tara:strand:+ start:1406 stop:1618 length:213 start_codon:yes stop_codon:yes gene_type:complete